MISEWKPASAVKPNMYNSKHLAWEIILLLEENLQMRSYQ